MFHQNWKELYDLHCRERGYEFTNNWFVHHIPMWQKIFNNITNVPNINFLEIGSLEGQSACWLLDNILTHPSSQITCIDTFQGSIEHQAYQELSVELSLIESRFDSNIKKTRCEGKVKKVVGISQNCLRKLPINHYDVIYIDGSHIASDVLEDTILSWRLLKDEGMMIFDDYQWEAYKDQPLKQPALAINSFLSIFQNQIDIIYKGFQVVIQKKSAFQVEKTISNLTTIKSLSCNTENKCSQSLSVCMMVQNSEKTLSIALSSLNNIYDELIIVDGGSTDTTLEIASKYGAKIINSPWSGNHSRQRNLYLKEVETDWVFVLDSDEFIDKKTWNFLEYLKVNGNQVSTDNFWIARKWISHFNKKLYISSSPHYPDWQRRIFKYNQAVSYNGQIHENIDGLQDKGQALPELFVYHLDLLINSESQRKQKVDRYTKAESSSGMPHYYIPDLNKLTLQKWNYQGLLLETQNLLNNIPVKCKICESDSHHFSTAKLLGKHDVDYFQCSNCGFVQTEESYWLDEAYSEAIAVSDVGLVYRNNMMANIASKLLFNYFDHEAKFLDYGGGYGLFVRLMRDKGFDFYWFDKFCKNIFACGFEFQDNQQNNLELITAFELLEHLTNPVQELKEILNLCPNILFSTELLPKDNPTPDKWWYYTPHEGQHISIFTLKSLEILASNHNLKLYSDGRSLHLLTTKQDLPANLFEELVNSNLQPITKKSLLSLDFNQVVNNLLLKNREADTNKLAETPKLKQPIIIIDGIFFQLSQNGIARVWKSLLEEWVNQEFSKHIIVLDRAGTAPKIPGIRYLTVPAYSYNDTDADRQMLQQVCNEEGTELFISTYYTTPIDTPSVFMAYDMIPELLGEELNIPMWQEKHYGINHASAYISISENTARDLIELFPNVSSELVTVTPCGIQNIFSPANYEEINQFKAKYNISKPYFILVGDRVGVNGYKNTSLFFNAFSQIPNSQDFEIVCVGSQSILEPQLRAYVPDATVHLLKLDDNELRISYSGAIALVYPSKYEGFGLPILEAMACGCPVITCPNGSIPEVGEEAVLYVDSDDVNELINKLLDVQQLEVRQSLIAAGLKQAKKFSWSSMAKQVSTALLKAVSLPPKKFIDAPISIEELTSWIEQYQKDLSNLSAIERLQQVRKQLADLWLELPAEEIAIAYRSEIGKTHKLLLDSGIRNKQLTDNEQAFVTNLLFHIDEKSDNLKAIQYLLALMQYQYPSELSDWFDLNAIPHWLLQDYLGFMLFSPAYFQETGEANSYYRYLEQFVDFIHSNIFSNPDSQLWSNVATYFAEKANFIPLYFNEDNLKGIYQKRAKIIELYLKNRNLPIEYEFAERSLQRQKIRLGILAYHFGVQTETFATLPIYKYLNRDLFEVILFPIKMSNHRLERYCAGHSDELIILPNNLQEQVQTIREADLDILFISTNLTAVTHQITLLASHRLARIQIVDANSPVSTGMRYIDYYISSKLSEPQENAQSHYTEKLITLDVPPQCFDFATEEQIVATTSVSRDSLGIDPNAVVYISGANFYKILPEVELTWTKIINQVPNSVLVLYPFNPNWSSSYPVTAFRKRINNTLAKYGLSEERLIILNPAPNRADVQERLKLADVYLDSYPYSGMTSLIDPLQVDLPSIVLEGKTSRSQKGASLLRSLQVTDLITDNEESYIQLAVKLGTNPELRKQKSDRIKQKMQQNPSFLDSRSYSAQMGALFQQLFQQDRAKNLIDRLGLRDINLVMFPDWHQSEESLYENFANVLKTMSSNTDKSRITLLIDTDGIDGEDANWLFSSVAMNLLMEEAVDIADELEVSLLDDLTENEWELLLSLLQGRIILDNENQNAIAKAKAQSLKVYN